MNIGILGGTFDPIHNEHLRLAEKARRQFKLDKVFFIPAGHPPHKKKVWAGQRERLAMLALALKGKKYFQARDWEIKRRGYSYTWQTLRLLKKKYPAAGLFFILGSDSLLELPTWKNYHRILRLCTLLVFRRPGFDPQKAEAGILQYCRLAAGRMKDISSTAIRLRAAQKRDLSRLVPAPVQRYIEKNGIY